MNSSPTVYWDKQVSLNSLMTSGAIELGRGNVISKKDIKEIPGTYPIYSSSAKNNGKMGEYGHYMFNEELISWSVDGGGDFFHRPKHKYSVTNVCGYMRKHSENFDYKFLHLTLVFQHGYLSFDYQTKAHPSVIRDIYWVPDIPLPEQQKIASILTSVDEVIEKTQSQINKLQDLKKGTMNELLTRGIGHTEFKDSPVGRIPKGWEVMSCSDVCSEVFVGIVIKPSQYYEASGVPVLRSANIKEMRVVGSNLKFISSESNMLLKKSKLKKGDVLTVRTGYPGTTSVVSKEFVGGNCVDLIVSRPSQSVLPQFLAIWVNSDQGKSQVLKRQGGLAQQHFNVGDMKEMIIHLPSLPEQQQIASILSSIDANIEEKQRKLQQTQSLKKSLMQDLLTGKVRVTVH